MTLIGQTTSTPGLESVTSTASPQLLKVGTIADLCGVSVRTIYRWIDREGLPVHRIPGAGLRPILRIAEADLTAWLSRHRHDPEVEDAAGPQTMTLDGMHYISPSPEIHKPELDTRRHFRPRVGEVQGRRA